jgi:hypothetical protein
MTQEEYKQKLVDLEDQYKKQKNEIIREYAYTNNPYATGAIISDHNNKIRVDKIMVGTVRGNEFPCCVYEGVQLNKDNTPNKRGLTSRVYQSDIVTTK